MRDYTLARTTLAAAVLSAALAATHAQQSEEQARTGAVADGVSSVLGVATGAIAVNPLFPLADLGVKAATLQYAERLPETERPGAYAFAAATWQGGAATNACATASALSGGSLLPACVAVGMAWGLKTWNESARERRLAERCDVLRTFVGKPNLPCAFMPRGIEPADDSPQTVVVAQSLVAP
jgi:hypothetical protein